MSAGTASSYFGTQRSLCVNPASNLDFCILKMKQQHVQRTENKYSYVYVSNRYSSELYKLLLSNSVIVTVLFSCYWTVFHIVKIYTLIL